MNKYPEFRIKVPPSTLMGGSSNKQQGINLRNLIQMEDLVKILWLMNEEFG